MRNLNLFFVVERMEETIKDFFHQNPREIYLHTHPFVEAYLYKKGDWMSQQMKWFIKYKMGNHYPKEILLNIWYRLYDADKKNSMKLL